MSYKVVLVRHGESLWNKENRFTGWTDVDLSEKGINEAKKAAFLLKSAGFEFDAVYTSMLKRAIKTMWYIVENTDQIWLPVTRAWQLNERHYGALQGLNKAETIEKFGHEQVHIWRRSFNTPPNPIKKTDPRHPSRDRRYKNLKKTDIPSTESLKDCMKRVVPYWKNTITPKVLLKKRILIVAHGNSIRALVKHLDGISDEQISEVNIPTGIPLIYELNKDLKPIRSYYLGDQEEVNTAINSVAAQTKSK